MSSDIETCGAAKGDTEKENKRVWKYKMKIWNMNEDFQVYITILLIILLSTIVVIIKIVCFDMDPDGKYSSIFGSEQVNRTSSPVLSTTTSSVSA